MKVHNEILISLLHSMKVNIGETLWKMNIPHSQIFLYEWVLDYSEDLWVIA